MTGLGLLMGIVFPFFVLALGVPANYVLHGAGNYSASALCILRDGDLVTAGSSGILEPEALAESELVQRSYRTLDA